MHKVLSYVLTFSLFVTVLVPPRTAVALPLLPQTSTAVTPPVITLDMVPGTTYTTTLTIRTAPTPIPKVDVFFLFDVTGSMGDELQEAKAKGTYIMNALRARVPDSAFGVGSFCDYPGVFSSPGYEAEYGGAGDYPWRLDQDLITDTVAVQQAIDRLSIHNGEDGPEDYSTALFESLFIGWRPGAKHILVLFGDAPAHDPSFYIPYGGKNFGVDPGPDGKANTSDDLLLMDVVSQLKDRGIVIMPISSARPGSYTQKGFEYMAQETGGRAYSLTNASELPEAVVQGLTVSTGKISSLSVQTDIKYASWVNVFPPFYTDVGGDETRVFNVMITIPSDAEPGAHAFTLSVVGDSATLGGTSVNINLPGATIKPAELVERKRQLIRSLSQFTYTTSFLGAEFTRTFTPTDTYLDKEKQVAAWLNTLPAPDALTPSQLDALHRLTEQEEGLYRLWLANAQAAHVRNSELAHIVGLVISVYTTWRHIFNLLDKQLVGRLVTKLNFYILAKATRLVETLLEAALSGMEDGTLKIVLQAEFKTLIESLQSILENALKTTNFARDFSLGVLGGLLETALVYPLDSKINSMYLETLGGEVDRGLQAAKEKSTTDVTLPEVLSQAPRTIAQVNAVVSPLEKEAEKLRSQQADLEEKHELINTTSEVVAGLSTGIALASGGSGGGISAMGHAFSLVLKVADGLLAGLLMRDSYTTWQKIQRSAPLVTDAAFGRGAKGTSVLPWGDSDSSWPASMLDRGEALSSLHLAPHLLQRLAALHTDVVIYTDLLTQLGEAVQAGDQRRAEATAEKLMSADTVLSNAFRIARHPVVAAAPAMLEKEDPAFADAYLQLQRSGAAFEGEGALLYLYLLGWLSDAKDASLKTSLLNQIGVVIDKTQAYESALVKALPLVQDVAMAPSVVIASHATPENLEVGREAILSVQVANPSPSPAQDVIINFDAGQGAQASSETKLLLGTLGAGESKTVEFRFVPTAETGLLSLTTSTSNGHGAFRIVPFLTGQRVLPLNQGGGDELLGLSLGLGFVIVITVIAYSRRTRLAKFGGTGQASALLVSLAGAGSFVVKDGSLIGRGADCHVRLSAHTVSHHHARLRYAQGRWYIQDMGSLNGTYVNGQRIQATALSPGDRVQLGDVVFVFQTKAP